MIEVVEQVNTDVTGVVIAAGGAVIFWVIVCVAVPVQPFAAVIVSVYTPGVVTVMLGLTLIIAGFVQE